MKSKIMLESKFFSVYFTTIINCFQCENEYNIKLNYSKLRSKVKRSLLSYMSPKRN